jgi:hypothetical protein
MIAVGDTVLTRTGKLRIVTSVWKATDPAKVGGVHIRRDCADTRALRDGKPFGSTRTYALTELTAVEEF